MPVSERALRRASSCVASLLLLATVASCTSDEEAPQEGGSTPEPTTAAQPVPLKVRIDKVAGDLTPKSRKRVVAGVEDSLQAYVNSALLGDYPRSDFALARFTAGAEKDARRDLDLLTGRPFRSAEAVSARQLKAMVRVVAPAGVPAGATAKVRFSFDVDGVAVVLAGRFLLTPQKGTWRIFGYDVSSNASDVAAAGGKG